VRGYKCHSDGQRFPNRGERRYYFFVPQGEGKDVVITWRGCGAPGGRCNRAEGKNTKISTRGGPKERGLG